MPGDIEARKRAQKRQAVQGAVLFAGLRTASVVVLLWSASLVPRLRWLQVILAVLALAVGVPVLFVGATLKQRFKEIEGGEQDAAAQY